MRTGAVILGGVSLLGFGLFLMGRNYYNGIYQLSYGLVGVGMQGDQWKVEIGVHNPTNHTYPVPMVFFNVYDKAGNYYGTIYSDRTQWITPGLSKLDTFLLPSYAALFAPIVSAIMGESIDLLLDGTLSVASFVYPLQIPIQQKLNM